VQFQGVLPRITMKSYVLYIYVDGEWKKKYESNNRRKWYDAALIYNTFDLPVRFEVDGKILHRKGHH